MARTAIPIYTIENYQAGTKLTGFASVDVVNGMSLDLAYAPKLMLVVFKFSSSTINFTIELPAGKSNFNNATSTTHTIGPAASGEFIRLIPVDVPPDLAQAGNLLHIDTSDTGFFFAAYTWEDTPVR